eukprot:TRINITY_DN11659_c0_g2_i3.p1 TRINITY_DN11659_c0_g2~~TRINITY_DN11659_c0_g2_i3.p1  ORF type:complete len:246 (+),score=85.54 TRINITY_DN11659_c0_g2_i3:140-877(+)
MKIAEVHPLNFALKYAPPTLVMQYYLGNDTSNEFVHQVSIFIKKNATAAKIVDELIRVESAYFDPKIVPRDQLTRLVQKLIDNQGKKIGKHKLKSNSARINEKTASSVQEAVQAQKVPETRPREKKKPEIPSLAGKLPGHNEDAEAKAKHENKEEFALESPLEGSENNLEDYNEGEEGDMIYGEAVDGDGKPIKLQRVMLEDENKEVLMDEEGNIYDLNGNYIGQLDAGGEEENEEMYQQNHGHR